MLKQELDKLSNDEKLIIIYWRIIDYPRVLSAGEIQQRLNCLPSDVETAIKKFNHNIRLKLEVASLQKECRTLLEKTYKDSYWDSGLV
jgi:hypothetical protein